MIDRRLRQLRIEFYRNSLHYYYTSVLSSIHLIAPLFNYCGACTFFTSLPPPLYNDYLSLNRRVRWVKLFTVASHYFFFINCVLVTTMVYNVLNTNILVLIIIVACLLSDVINFEYLIILMVSDNYYIC